MSNSNNTSDSGWGLYPWFVESGLNLIHPDDAEAFEKLGPYGLVFHYKCDGSEYLQLTYADQAFRVRPKLLQPIEPPARHFGEPVSIAKGGEVISGIVRDIRWHYGRQRHFFHIAVGGKQLKKRYWMEDFK